MRNPCSFPELSFHDNCTTLVPSVCVYARLVGAAGGASVIAVLDGAESTDIVGKPMAGCGYCVVSPTVFVAFTL